MTATKKDAKAPSSKKVKMPKEFRAWFSKLGKRYGASGGNARAANLSEERRREIASQAGLASAAKRANKSKKRKPKAA